MELPKTWNNMTKKEIPGSRYIRYSLLEQVDKLCYPKNPWTLQWKGLNLYSRGQGPEKSHFWGVRSIMVHVKVVYFLLGMEVLGHRPLMFLVGMAGPLQVMSCVTIWRISFLFWSWVPARRCFASSCVVGLLGRWFKIGGFSYSCILADFCLNMLKLLQLFVGDWELFEPKYERWRVFWVIFPW